MGQPRWSADNFADNYQLVTALEAVAKSKGCTVAQISLAWVHHQGDDIFSITGTSKIENLLQNLAAARIQLSSDDLASIERACPSPRRSRVSAMYT